MPCAAGRVSLGPDNLDFRRRLRLVHPDTEEAMRKQREECVEVRSGFVPLQMSESRHCGVWKLRVALLQQRNLSSVQSTLRASSQVLTNG